MESSRVNRSVGRMERCGALISEGPSLYMSICEGGLVGGKIEQTLLLFVLTLFAIRGCVVVDYLISLNLLFYSIW